MSGAVAIARITRISPTHVSCLEIGFGLEVAGLQQRQQVIEFQEVVLHGRGGQQQDVLLLQFAGKAPKMRSAVAQVVRLVDLEGLSYREAAERLDVPVGTVMSRLHRGRRLLAGLLTEAGSAQPATAAAA